jgi:NTE family protein
MVLGGGGAKTAAHIGAARALQEAGIEVVRWIGTSMGAVVAAMLASGADPDEVLRRVIAIQRRDVLRTDWRVLVRGIWAGSLMKPAPLRQMIERLVPVESFAAMAVPLTVTAVDVASGRELVFGAGGDPAPLVDALAAACALPPYFPPVRVNGRSCYDGGIRAAVPIERAIGIECTFVVAIDTGPGFDATGDIVDVPPPLVAATDSAMGWLMATTTALQRAAWEESTGRPPLIWLRPVTDRGAIFAAERTARYAEAGYQAMHHVLEEMQ